jgi:hypothetical protein
VWNNETKSKIQSVTLIEFYSSSHYKTKYESGKYRLLLIITKIIFSWKRENCFKKLFFLWVIYARLATVQWPITKQTVI